MEPWATFGHRVRGLSGQGKKADGPKKIKIGNPKAKFDLIRILNAIASAKKSLNRIPFYRQRGQR